MFESLIKELAEARAAERAASAVVQDARKSHDETIERVDAAHEALQRALGNAVVDAMPAAE